MRDNFCIEMETGPTIFIEVQEGIVMDCNNQDFKLGEQMNKLYLGETIVHLQEHFSKMMKPSFVAVKSVELSNKMKMIDAIKNRLKNLNIGIESTEKKDVKKLMKKNRERYLYKLQKSEAELLDLQEVLREEHGFETIHLTKGKYYE